MSFLYEALQRAGRPTAVIDLVPRPAPEPLPDIEPPAPPRTWPSWIGRPSWEAEESYRKGALFLARLAGEQRVRSMLFCSARRREGTTTAVLNLAHRLRDDHSLRPLVVELDRRKPTLARLFNLDPDRCLYSALTGSRPVRESIQETASGLSVIPGDRLGRVRPPLDFAAALRRVVDEVAETYDFVLVDAPPVLSHADAIIAATVVRRVVLVVQAGRTSSEVLDRMKREISSDGTSIVGALLTKHRRHIPGWIYWYLER
jgi:succinoglycan biosynthesis transport protein ExoP